MSGTLAASINLKNRHMEIINKMKVKFGNLSQHELAVMNMPSEAEIRQAECIADHTLAMPGALGKQGCMTQSSDQMQIRAMFHFPKLGEVVQSEGKVGSKYQYWYLRTMEIWAERQAEHYRQAVLDMSAESEGQLKMDQHRMEVIEFLDGGRTQLAKKVVAAWRRSSPGFNAAYPKEEAIPA